MEKSAWVLVREGVSQSAFGITSESKVTYTLVPGIPDLVGADIECTDREKYSQSHVYLIGSEITHSSKAKAPAKAVVRRTVFLRRKVLNAANRTSVSIQLECDCDRGNQGETCE